MIDRETGCNDDYDAALRWSIEEIINEIHRIKELETGRLENVYYSIFGKDIEVAYQEYLKELAGC